MKLGKNKPVDTKPEAAKPDAKAGARAELSACVDKLGELVGKVGLGPETPEGVALARAKTILAGL